MQIKNFVYLVFCFIFVVFLVFQGLLPAWAQNQVYQQALKEYNAHHYSEAALLFNNFISLQLKTNEPLFSQLPSLKDNASLVYALMYEAICIEQLGDNTHASAIYKLLSQRYEGSAIGDAAKKALIHPQIVKETTPNPGTTRSAMLDSLPKQTWVPFKRFGNLMLVEGYINDNKTGMLFDTGAAGCLFSTEQLKSLGIAIPKGTPNAAVSGIGTHKQTPAWTMYVDLKLGSISRRQFPVQINDNPLNYPLLGVNFFEGMEYTIDNQSNVIEFKTLANNSPSLSANKMTVTVDSSSHYVYNVPFSELNGAIVVKVKIGDKECQMMIDTGTDICLFTNSQLKSFGLNPHLTGRMITCKGAAGFMKAPLCLFENAEFGPITGPLACLVTDQAYMPLPLLGQNFLKGWQLTVDHTSHLIKLIRK